MGHCDCRSAVLTIRGEGGKGLDGAGGAEGADSEDVQIMHPSATRTRWGRTLCHYCWSQCEVRGAG